METTCLLSVHLTVEQAEAVGYAVKTTLRNLKASRAWLDSDPHADDLIARLDSAYSALDSASPLSR